MPRPSSFPEHGTAHVVLRQKLFHFDVEYSRELILAHPDRFVFARDNFDSALITLIDGMELPEAVSEAFYSGNMLRLMHMV